MEARRARFGAVIPTSVIKGRVSSGNSGQARARRAGSVWSFPFESRPLPLSRASAAGCQEYIDLTLKFAKVSVARGLECASNCWNNAQTRSMATSTSTAFLGSDVLPFDQSTGQGKDMKEC